MCEHWGLTKLPDHMDSKKASGEAKQNIYFVCTEAPGLRNTVFFNSQNEINTDVEVVESLSGSTSLALF